MKKLTTAILLALFVVGGSLQAEAQTAASPPIHLASFGYYNDSGQRVGGHTMTLLGVIFRNADVVAFKIRDPENPEEWFAVYVDRETNEVLFAQLAPYLVRNNAKLESIVRMKPKK